MSPPCWRLGRSSRAATINIQTDQPGHKVAPTLWGVFFEDINLSADGGIYPELVRNRSFEDAGEPEIWTFTHKRDERNFKRFHSRGAHLGLSGVRRAVGGRFCAGHHRRNSPK